MSEQISKISRETLIPISMVISIGIGIWALATMNAKISTNERDISQIEAQCASNPSRAEFQQMRDDINEIKGDVKKLILSSK